MRGMLGAAATAVAIALVAIAPASAGARSLELEYRAGGSVRATWTTASGERGELLHSVSSKGTVTVGVGGGGGSSGASSLSVSSAAVVRVTRDLPGGGRETCIEPLPGGPAGIDVEDEGPARLRVFLSAFGDDRPELSAGRCAGPLPQDLAPLLPTARLAVRRASRAPRTVPLRTRRRFSAGGVTGTLVSTVAVRFRRARRVRDDDEGITVIRRKRARAAVIEPRALDGTLTTTFRGGESPACRLLAACAVEGVVTLQLLDPETTPQFDPDTRADRLDARAVLNARVRRPGLPDCVDRAEGRVSLELDHRLAPGNVEVAELRERPPDRAFEASADTLRTRCTGPAGRDLRGLVIARGERPPSTSGEPPPLVLRAARDLRPGPFAGSQRGELTVVTGADGE